MCIRRGVGRTIFTLEHFFFSSFGNRVLLFEGGFFPTIQTHENAHPAYKQHHISVRKQLAQINDDDSNVFKQQQHKIKCRGWGVISRNQAPSLSTCLDSYFDGISFNHPS